jgi:cysteine synthase
LAIPIDTKFRVVPVEPSAALVCSPLTLRVVEQYAEIMGISAKRAADEIISDWMEAVGVVRMDAAVEKRRKISQNEKKGATRR